jgi:hypothetical protein
MAMNCWACKTELIWGGDHDVDTDGPVVDTDEEEYLIVTNLHCPKCDSFVLVYWGK